MLSLKFVLVAVTVHGVFGRSVNDAQSKNIPAIVGGNEVDIRQYPHQVVILLMGWLHCGGSIISEEYVLTAAHCFDMSDNPGDYQIRAGSTYSNKGGELYNISSLVKHPKFFTKFFESEDYDIAVAKVSGKIAIDGVTTKIVKLPDSDSDLEAGDLVTATGWGETKNLKSTEVLKAVTLPVVDRCYCDKVWKKIGSKFKINQRMLCAGFKKSSNSTCHGDSGGPLIDANNVQYGIVSFGSCKRGHFPNVFTFIPALRDWIKRNAGV